MIRQPIPTWLFITLAICGFATGFFAYAGYRYRLIQKNPSQTVAPGIRGFSKGFEEITKTRGSEKRPKPSWVVTDVKATYWRLFVGLAAGTFFSIIIGIAMGAYPAVEAFFNPAITFMAKIPPTAMLVVYMVLFKIGLELYVALVGFGVFFTMSQAIFQAVKKDVAADLIDKAYTLGASEFEVMIEVIWKQVLPRILDNIRLHLGPAWVFLIAAEMLFASEGFGYTIRQQGRLNHMNVVFLYLAILGISGLMFDWLLLRLRRWLCPWFGD